MCSVHVKMSYYSATSHDVMSPAVVSERVHVLSVSPSASRRTASVLVNVKLGALLSCRGVRYRLGVSGGRFLILTDRDTGCGGVEAAPGVVGTAGPRVRAVADLTAWPRCIACNLVAALASWSLLSELSPPPVTATASHVHHPGEEAEDHAGCSAEGLTAVPEGLFPETCSSRSGPIGVNRVAQ